MSKQNLSKSITSECAEESSIVLNPKNPETNSPVPKIVATTFLVANALMLSTTPISKAQMTETLYDNVFVEHGEIDSELSYPTLKLRYEEGQVSIQGNGAEIISTIDNKHSGLNVETTVDITFEQIIGDLRKENAILRNRLNNSLPVHSIIYISGNSIIIALAIFMLFLRYCCGIYIVDPYYIICALIIAITLLGTAVVSLKDWKSFLNER